MKESDMGVSDNGVSLPKDFDLQNTASLGLRLVNVLANQMGGTVEIDRSSGTTFKITFAG
jgi:two-component sensor histidine kinase